jgi:ribosomal protein L37E
MYTIARNGQEVGKYAKEEILEGLKSGFFFPTDFCWKTGMPAWKTISDEFAAEVPPPMPRPGVPPIPTTFPAHHAQGPLGHTMICRQCGTTSYKVETQDSSFIPKGSASWWLFMIFLFPFSLLVYFIMENKSKETQACKTCGSNALIPVHSPEGSTLLARSGRG